MCALVSAVRKIGIVAGGPGLGDAANPMHIVRTTEAVHPSQTPSTDRPSTSSSEFDPSLGQKKRVVMDPATQVDDDQGLPEELTYYTEENLERHLSVAGDMRSGVADGRNLQSPPQVAVQRGKSFGRRRRQVNDDLEKGPRP